MYIGGLHESMVIHSKSYGVKRTDGHDRLQYIFPANTAGNNAIDDNSLILSKRIL